MQITQLSLAFAILAGLTNGAALAKRADTLKVTLTQVDNALVKAVVQNLGADDLNLFAFGTIFDKAPVEKLSVLSGSM
jgi:deuterolysin